MMVMVTVKVTVPEPQGNQDSLSEVCAWHEKSFKQQDRQSGGQGSFTRRHAITLASIPVTLPSCRATSASALDKCCSPLWAASE